MEFDPANIEKTELQAHIDRLERELAENPDDAEFLRFRLKQSRALMSDLFEKPIAVLEQEYRVLMEEHAAGKSYSGEEILMELRSMIGE